MRGRGRIYAARSLPADSRLPYTRGPGIPGPYRAALSVNGPPPHTLPSSGPAGPPSPKGEGKGYLYPVICRVPSRLLQQQRLDLHAAQRSL